MHVLLKVLPAFPGATLHSEDTLEHRDTAFDPSSKSSQLAIRRDNSALGEDSFAAGKRAKAIHDGVFVWASDPFGSESDFSSTASHQFLIRARGGVGIGTSSPQGALDVNGSIYQSGGVLHADYVFEDHYKLESIEEHAEFMWREKRLPGVAPAQKNDEGQEFVEYGARSRGTLEELEKAHIYIEQLNDRIKGLEAELAQIQEMIANGRDGN